MTRLPTHPPANPAGEVQAVARKLPAGSRKALVAMTAEWQFCGKATFNASGAWNASWAAKCAVERASMKDGKWSRHAYRLTPFGLAVKSHLLTQAQAPTCNESLQVAEQEESNDG